MKKYNCSMKFVSRTLFKNEVEDLVKGKKVLIAIFDHKKIRYELVGYLKVVH